MKMFIADKLFHLAPPSQIMPPYKGAFHMKSIESVEMRAGDIKTGFGNPRKISKKHTLELERSLDAFGNFGLFVIDENDNIIAGNQRLSIIKKRNPEEMVLCKRLIGYSEAEKRAINIKDNTHSGEWDLDLLADWTADLNVDLGLDLENGNPDDVKIAEMELKTFEHWDYIVFVFDNQHDWLNILDHFKIGKVNAGYGATKKIGIGRVIHGKRLLDALRHKDINTEQR
jgi:hypothetical protein